ncbi:g11505 [Coccomyxa viridis]|uniref:G11505 protein n=1 Tax=Coccomyxa viridis TaxID=1274662 RepID=A0ABP1G998_9CHLO
MVHTKHGSSALYTVLLGLCFLALASANEEQIQLAQPDFAIYHTKEQILEEVDNIAKANPHIMKAKNIEYGDESAENPYRANMKVVTVEPGGHTHDHSRKIRLLLNYGEHGRELITVEVALRLLQTLADPSAELQLAEKLHGAGRPDLQATLHNTIFKIIPMENERGREMVEAGALCERKNGRGVDTNRNWEVHWGFKEKDYDPSEEFPGEKPFSEPEAAALLALATQFKPHVWMNVHSGMEALFMPYDHLASIPKGKTAQATLEVLEKMNNISCGGRCAVGSGGKSVGYLAHGTATDYMYDRLNVPLSLTWEIYGDTEATFNDCFRMFNPTTREKFEEVVANWANAIFALLELLPMHPAIPKPRNLGRKVEVGAVLPKAVQAVQDAKVERKLGSAMHMSMHSNMTDSARIGAQLFGIPQARKGLVGGVCVIAVLCVGLVIMLRGYSTGKKGRRRRLQSV